MPCTDYDAVLPAQLGALAYAVGALAGRLCVAGITTPDDLEALLACTERAASIVDHPDPLAMVGVMRSAAEVMVAAAGSS